MKWFHLFFFSQNPVIIVLLRSSLIFFCRLSLLPHVPVSNLPSVLWRSGASQIAFVHLRSRPWTVLWAGGLVWKESAAAGWLVEIAVIMKCYLFIKHAVGTLPTAFRNQLKRHKLLTLATLAGGVCACVCVCVWLQWARGKAAQLKCRFSTRCERMYVKIHCPVHTIESRCDPAVLLLRPKDHSLSEPKKIVFFVKQAAKRWVYKCTVK